MGIALSSPVELIRVQRHGCLSFRCAVAEMQGWRISHEDAHEAHCDGTTGSFWVLDGHGGDGAANYSAPEIVKEFTGTSSPSNQKGGKLKSPKRDEKEKQNNPLPSGEELEDGLASVDERLRSHFAQYPDKMSGSTVVGALAALQSDDTYSVKLCNCGDSRGILVRGPTESEGAAKAVSVRLPRHLACLKEEAHPNAANTVPSPGWPVITESVDHKPNHCTERARIEAAGGWVTEDVPPRLDGNLAVSRGLGDFEYKKDLSQPVSTQKVSCIPDVYEIDGLQQGSLCILACDGVWDVLKSEFVASFVRGWLGRDPSADLGDIAAEIIRICLQRNSRDNVTVMIVHFVDGSDWATQPDEMRNHEKLAHEAELFDDEVRRQYALFLRRAMFPLEPSVCPSCNRWMAGDGQCPCKVLDGSQAKSVLLPLSRTPQTDEELACDIVLCDAQERRRQGIAVDGALKERVVNRKRVSVEGPWFLQMCRGGCQ
jgi:serine/threonine protein phosphatase PrpC